MAEQRGIRKTRVGVVVSDKMDKTIARGDPRRAFSTALYGKIMNRTVKFKAHDENNECGIGDTVRVMETRPLSKGSALENGRRSSRRPSNYPYAINMPDTGGARTPARRPGHRVFCAMPS